MKPREAAANLLIKVPPGDRKGGNTSSSTPLLSVTPKELQNAIPKLTDISPLNWRKRTSTTPSKAQSAGIEGSRNALKNKASAPDLGRRKLHATSIDSPKLHRRPGSHGADIKKKSSAPDLRRSRGDYTPGVGGCPSLPRHKGSTFSLRGSDQKRNDAEDGPRFMGAEERPAASPSRFNPRPQIGAPKLPSIIGTAPSRMKTKQKEVKRVRESRAKQMMKILMHSDVSVRCKSAVRNLNRMRMLRRIHGCARLIRANARRKAIAIESRPIYQLRERKRASVMLSLPNIQRLPSMKSISDLVQVDPANDQDTQEQGKDIEKDSDGSVYEKSIVSVKAPSLAPAPDQPVPGTSTALAVNCRDSRAIRRSMLPFRDWLDILESSANPFSDEAYPDPVPSSEVSLEPPVNLAEDHSMRTSLRASLLPFRDWLVIFDANRNTLLLDDPSEPLYVSSSSSETLSGSSTLALSSPTDPNSSPRSSRLSPSIPQESSLSLPGDRRPNVHSLLSSGSLVPLSIDSVMAASSPQDPFVDPSAVEGEGLTQIESQVFAYHHEEPTEDPRAMTSPVENTPTAQTPRVIFQQKDCAGRTSSQSIRSRADAGPSRIPRASTQKRPSGLRASTQRAGAAVTPENHGSITASVRKQSAGESESHETPDHRFSGGIRMIDRPSGLRHRLPASYDSDLEIEPLPPAAEDSDSSSISTFGNSIDPDDLASQRPTGLTGEHRVRPTTRAELLERYGAQLKIAPSAERVILGQDNDASEHPTQSLPSAREHSRKATPIPRYEHLGIPRGPSGQTRLPRETSGSSLTPGGSREARTLCRPQPPSGNHSRKNDFSHKELRMHRSPTSKPSFQEDGENYDSEDIPPVPRVPTVHKSESNRTIHSIEHIAPQGTPEFYAEMAARVDPFHLRGPLDSHPPRSSSKRDQADLDIALQGEQTDESPEDSALTLTRYSANVEDHAPEHGQHDHTGNGGRLSDSKSTRMFDSFRSIFSKSKGEKGATGKESSGGSNTKRVRNASDGAELKIDQSAKAKTRWSKSTRSLKVDNISTPVPLPSPASYSSTPAPPSRGRQDAHTPSFARPTQATRTRAAASAKQTSISQEARMHRIKVLTPSTGSPSRTARIHKRINKVAASTPNTGSEPEKPIPPVKDSPIGGKLADSGRIGIDSVQAGIESLCAKICGNTDPTKIAKYLRLALELQQQLSDYKSVEKEARDLEALLVQKKGDKGLALNSLIQYLDKVRLQVDED